ncbi:hypothetical protein [Shewanella gaetbuli]|uniref:Uncharacterized protein n=1 Tax=Shewanella gaetbuli TaxID=220752 RepID=A0A9X2CK72_9GAMM|nr:hypothetical protein [Shewanella gaetbuli]MCL1141305.1 hypothetical protein [Shewanella gaetbuli]
MATISNAKRWNELCELQIQVMSNMAEQFPQRRESLAQICEGWRNVTEQLKLDKIPIIK